MKTWKENLEETKKHYVNWWNHKGIVVNMWEHFQEGVAPHGPYSGEQPIHLTEVARNNYGTGAFGLPGAPQAKDGNQRWFDPEWRAGFLDWYVGHSCLKADMLPVANTQLGPGSLASILGSRVEGGEDTIWIHPNPNFSDKLTFDPNNEQLRIHKELLKACKRKANGNYYVGMPDLMEGLDVLAALKGTDKVLLDTVMQPEVVEEQLQFINDVYFKVFDELYDIIREGDEMAFCYFSSWAPGKMTKIQSDISTMISEDDYRRFVQPYLREQCQKIPYTLYHLDGVGAMHHLPALLEIEELNAIQWTPGVGEPQGGDHKWYDLYKKIIAGGKSIMACWVTLDQLRPLLDNVGGDGIHLEMDFHNEDEVEQALRIVEEYQTKEVERKVDECLHIGDMTNFAEKKAAARFRPLHIGGKQIVMPSDKALASSAISISKPSLAEAMESRMLVFDGAMGTSIQKYGLENVKSNEYLCVEHPEVISDIYRKFLLAGADVITANTFNAQSVSLKACGLESKAAEINTAAVNLARGLADAFTIANPEKPRYVLGEIGPTRETLSMPESAKITRQELFESYKEQAAALVKAGVDGIIFETVFDLVNLEIGLEAAGKAMEELEVTVPILISANFSTADGTNMIGQNIIEYFSKLKNDNVIAVGVNCNPDIEMTTAVVAELGAATPYYIIAFPNAGFPDAKGNYPTTPQEFRRQMWEMIDGHLVNLIGGCCGTTHEHIRKIAELVNPAEGCFVSGHRPGEASATGGHKPVAAAKPVVETPAKEKPVASEPSEMGLKDAIIAGKEAVAVEATKKAVEAGANPAELINTQMIEAMSVVGQRFSEGKAFVPNLLMAGRAMKAALGILKPIMEASGEGVQSAGKIVIGTVKGDLHDIGKNLVASMLEGSGFEVINVGIDVDAETFVKAVVDNEADILCLSALLTTTMTYMVDCLAALEAAGIRKKVKVMVGGAPVTEEFAREIGADGYSSNANEAVALAKRLMS